MDEESEIIHRAARENVYIYASPFHSSSQALADISTYYKSTERARAATATVQSRIKAAGDLYEMRLDGAIGIRMSRTRETDRFTLLLGAEIDRVFRSTQRNARW